MRYRLCACTLRDIAAHCTRYRFCHCRYYPHGQHDLCPECACPTQQSMYMYVLNEDLAPLFGELCVLSLWQFAFERCRTKKDVNEKEGETCLSGQSFDIACWIGVFAEEVFHSVFCALHLVALRKPYVARCNISSASHIDHWCCYILYWASQNAFFLVCELWSDARA